MCWTFCYTKMERVYKVDKSTAAALILGEIGITLKNVVL